MDVIETDTVDVELNDEGIPNAVNSYKFVRFLGEGAFAKVYLCEDTTGHQYAMKIVNKSFLKRKREFKKVNGKMICGTAFEKVQREVAIMKKLSHGNLVQLHEIIDCPENDKMFLVLELVHGGQVMQWDSKKLRYSTLAYSNGVLPKEIVRNCLVDVIMALEYLHTNHICHRDIKPENILMDNESMVFKLADFGVAHILDDPDHKTLRSTEGTHHFLAPECTTGLEYDPYKVDIWALGVTMFALLQGSVPFGSEATSVVQVMEAIKNEELVLDTTLDADCVFLMRRMMEKDPALRITMEELKCHPWLRRSVRAESNSFHMDASRVVITDQDIEAAFTPVNNFILMTKVKIKMAGRLARARNSIDRRNSMDSPPASPERGPRFAAFDFTALALNSAPTTSNIPVETLSSSSKSVTSALFVRQSVAGDTPTDSMETSNKFSLLLESSNWSRRRSDFNMNPEIQVEEPLSSRSNGEVKASSGSSAHETDAVSGSLTKPFKSSLTLMMNGEAVEPSPPLLLESTEVGVTMRKPASPRKPRSSFLIKKGKVVDDESEEVHVTNKKGSKERKGFVTPHQDGEKLGTNDGLPTLQLRRIAVAESMPNVKATKHATREKKERSKSSSPTSTTTSTTNS